MTRESSSFNMRRVLANCCGRQTPLFTVSLVSLLLAMPITLILTIQSVLSNQWNNQDVEMRRNLVERIRDMMVYQAAASVVLAVLAVVAGIALFHYLHVRSQVDFFHALPITRPQMFRMRVLIGVLAVVPAYLLSVLLSCGVCAAYGYADAIDVPLLLWSVCVHVIFFLVIYAASVLAAVLCGNTLVSLLLCAWIQAGLAFGTVILDQLLYIFYPARWPVDDDFASWLSPVTISYRLLDGIEDLGAVPAILALIGAIAVLFAAGRLFRARKSEHAGVSMAFPGMEQPLKLFMVTVLGVGCGLLVQTITGSWWIMFVGMVFGGVLTACVAEIVYDLDFHSLFRRRKSLLIYGAVCAAVMAFMAMDTTGWNSRLPERGEVTEAYLNSYCSSWNCSAQNARPQKEEDILCLKSEENVDRIYKSAQMGADTIRRNRKDIRGSMRYASDRYEVLFRLENDKTFKRTYYLPSDTAELAENGAKVRFSEEYREQFTAEAQAERNKERISKLMAGNYWEVENNVVKTIDDSQAIIDILTTLKRESMDITREYAEQHAPVFMLNALTEQEEQEILRQGGNMYWNSFFYIPVYESETETLRLLKKHLPELSEGFGPVEDVIEIRHDIPTEHHMQTVSYMSREDIAEQISHLIPSNWRDFIDPVYTIDPDSGEWYVKHRDGTVLYCSRHQ